MLKTKKFHRQIENVEAATTTAFTFGVTPLTVAHELNMNEDWSIPGVENIPGIDHSTSALGSFVVAAGITDLMERRAKRLEDRGNKKGAERMRRYSVPSAFLGSLAAQLAIETNPYMGVGDKWDVVAGMLSTAPGILAARLANKSVNEK